MRIMNCQLIAILLALFIFAGNGIAQEADRSGVLTLGRATDDVVKYHQRYGPIIEYIAERLGDVGIHHGEVVLAADNESSTLFRLIRDGALDMMIESAIMTNVAQQEAGVVPLAVVLFSGIPDYQAFLVVRKDSAIASLEELKGHIVAFEDPGSTSGFWLPANELRVSGFNLVEVDSFDAAVPSGKIGYVFAGSEINVSGWLFYRKVSAGALSSGDWNDPENLPPAFRDEFRILWKSRAIPRAVLSVSRDMDSDIAGRILEELLQMPATDEGRKALASYPGVSGFAALTDAQRQGLIDLNELIQEKVSN